MMRIGAFLEAGGNKVFFVNGVLSALAAEGIQIDYLAGYSSAAPIILAHFAGLHTQVLNDFAARLGHNKKNFYLFKSPHFPQDAIYGNAVEALVERYREQPREGSFTIYGAATTPRFPVLKSLAASKFLFLRYALHLDLLGYARWLLGLRKVEMTDRSDFNERETADFILGSSSLYPFIRYCIVRGSLVLEGALLGITPETALAGCEKKVVIHTDHGTTGLVGDTFHIYSKSPVPENVLDYTNGDAVRTLQAEGEAVAGAHLAELRRFLAA